MKLNFVLKPCQKKTHSKSAHGGELKTFVGNNRTFLMVGSKNTTQCTICAIFHTSFLTTFDNQNKASNNTLLNNEFSKQEYMRSSEASNKMLKSGLVVSMGTKIINNVKE